MEVRKFRLEDASAVAELHISAISTAFISSLGVDFVTALYEAVGESETSFSFVAEEANKIVGFVAFTANINELYKSVVLRKGIRFGFLLVGKMFSLRRIKKVFETLLYPTKTKKMNLPKAELLSIAVAEEYQDKGLGLALVKRGFEECVRRRIEKIKVLVDKQKEPANKLYLKCGFELAGQIRNHGVLSNIYVAKAIKTD